MEIAGAQQTLQQQQQQREAAAPSAGVTARVIRGDASNLRVGDVVAARVAQANADGTVLDLAGRRLTTQQLPGARVGQELAVRVLATRPETVLRVAQPPGDAADLVARLETGQQLTGRIVEQLGTNRFLLDVDGNLLDAAGPQSLRGRGVLALQVEQLQPQLVFRVLGRNQLLERVAIETLTQNLEGRQTIAESLGNLRDALANFFGRTDGSSVPPALARLNTLVQSLFPQDGPQTSDQFLTLLREGGLDLEAALGRLARGDREALERLAQNDFKAVLLRGLQSAAEGRTPEARSLAESILAQLNQIESQQLLNILSLFHNEAFQLQVPFVQEQPQTAFLSIEQDDAGPGREDEDGEPGFNVLLSLDLDSFGRTRIDARVGETSVRTIFYVEHPEAIHTLQNAFPELEESLRGLGFQEILLAAKPLDELPKERQQRFETLAKGVPESIHLVDLKV
ncbi:MAG: flagellar hook-length control protein FliK [Planctomycetes bacterium]|nr:flagellar hook-length control protein FliK [Planctomycetota bacterium]